MDDAPPPFVSIQDEDDVDVRFNDSDFYNNDKHFAELAIPSQSKSPSPVPNHLNDKGANGKCKEDSIPPLHNTEEDSVAEESVNDGDDFDDDDFGDFGEAPPPQECISVEPSWSVEKEDEPSESVETKNEEWAAFTGSSVEKDEWSADFASAPPPEEQIQTPVLPSLECLIEDDCIWDFKESSDSEEDDDDGDAFDFVCSLDSEAFHSSIDNTHPLHLSSSFWLALRVVEEASALKHEWSGSALSRILLDLLRIDPSLPTRGILPPTNLPLSSGILQPTPINHQSQSVPPPSIPSSDPTPLPVEKAVDPPMVNSLSVPPAVFEWDKSGLTNPLTAQAVSSSSAILDVDFLAGNNAPSSSISTLQKDLDLFGLSATTASGGMPKVPSQPSVLDTLMSSRSRRYKAPTELSLDARALHDALPDFDYMRATWISFPISSLTDDK